MLETDICAPKIIVHISVIDYLKHIKKKKKHTRGKTKFKELLRDRKMKGEKNLGYIQLILYLRRSDRSLSIYLHPSQIPFNNYDKI